ncbi:hypothetical protein ACF3M2_05160 [Tissierella carlieri]|uniref:hypothetical protein n=1 Tax=Tissierella carlieri TaxID=689904 RepID=UPI003866EFBD
MQSKINESISNVENAYSRVESILSDLNRNLDIMQRELRSVEEGINMILER